MWRILIRLISPGSVMLMAACTTPMFTMPPGPSDYRVAFHDGCDAGYAYAGSPFYQPSDAAQPSRSDEPYHSGWRAGFERCRAHYQRIQRTVSSVLGPP
jgi:hypothetical protein